MLKIRAEQLAAMQPLADRMLAANIVERLRQLQGELVIRLAQTTTTVASASDTLLRRLVETGIVRAREHGLATESSLGSFVFLMFHVGPAFDRHAAIRDVLTDPTLPPDWRIDALWRRIDEATFDEARGAYDPAAWEPER